MWFPAIHAGRAAQEAPRVDRVVRQEEGHGSSVYDLDH